MSNRSLLKVALELPPWSPHSASASSRPVVGHFWHVVCKTHVLHISTCCQPWRSGPRRRASSRESGRLLHQIVVEGARVHILGRQAAGAAPPTVRARLARGGQCVAATARPEDPRLSAVHEDAAGHGDHQAGHEHDDSHQEAHGGRGGRGHALAALGEVEDVAGGADSPRGHGTDAHAVDGVPLHAAEDAGVPPRLVLAEAPAAPGLVVLVGAAVVPLHGAVAAAAHVLLHLQDMELSPAKILPLPIVKGILEIVLYLYESALRLRLHPGELRQDDHDLQPLGPGGDGHAAVRVEVAGAAATIDGGEVGDHL